MKEKKYYKVIDYRIDFDNKLELVQLTIKDGDIVKEINKEEFDDYQDFINLNVVYFTESMNKVILKIPLNIYEKIEKGIEQAFQCESLSLKFYKLFIKGRIFYKKTMLRVRVDYLFSKSIFSYSVHYSSYSYFWKTNDE